MIIQHWINPNLLLLSPLFLLLYCLIFSSQQRKFNRFAMAYPELCQNSTLNKKLYHPLIITLLIVITLTSLATAFFTLNINIALAILLLTIENITLALIYTHLHKLISHKTLPIPSQIKNNIKAFYTQNFTRKNDFRFTLFFIALTLLWIAAIRPQGAPKSTEIKREGIEAIFLLDLSNSMLATDLIPSRLEAAKLEINEMLENMNSDKLGLILFTDKPFVQTPLTRDKNAIKSYLKTAHPNNMPSTGTALAPAMWMAFEHFYQQKLSFNDIRKIAKKHDKNYKTRIIILATDGEDHDENALQIAKIAKDLNIPIYTVAFGTSLGRELTYPDNSPMTFENKPIHSKLNFDLLKKISSISGGQAFHYTSPQNTARDLENALNKLQKMAFDDALVIEGTDLYPPFLWIAALLLSIMALIPTKTLNLRNK